MLKGLVVGGLITNVGKIYGIGTKNSSIVISSVWNQSYECPSRVCYRYPHIVFSCLRYRELLDRGKSVVQGLKSRS